MGTEFGSHDHHDRILREWLLLLLRFAITQEALDRSAALTMAEELDSLGTRWKPAAPHFFGRATSKVCDAITGPQNAQRDAVLRTHLARIDEPRLKRAFGSAVGLPPSLTQPQRTAAAKKNFGLWKGLPTK